MTHDDVSDRSQPDWWRQPLALALLLSLLLHGLFYGTWQLGRVYGWWDVSVPFLTRLLDRLSSVLVDTEQIQEALERQQQLADEEMTLMFVDVAPAQASTEKPDNPRFYGAFNSQAASVEASEQDQELPKIDGEQDKEFKTFDVPRETPQAASQAQQPAQLAALEPAPEPVAIDADRLQPTPEPEAKPAGQPDAPVTPLVETKATEAGSPEDLSVRTPVTPKPGDLVRAPVKTQPERGDGAVRRGDNGEAVQPPRPRTIAQARAQLPQETGIVGQKMQTDGGSRMQRVMPSFNTEGTIWGQYDAKLVAIIKSRWYRYLDQHPEAFNWAGRVAVRFQLHYDGRVTNYEVLENNSGEMQGYGAFKAIMGDAGEPYDPWPPSLRRSTAKDFRELRFTFYYN